MIFKFKNSLLTLKNMVLKIGYFIYLVEIEEKLKVDFNENLVNS